MPTEPSPKVYRAARANAPPNTLKLTQIRSILGRCEMVNQSSEPHALAGRVGGQYEMELAAVPQFAFYSDLTVVSFHREFTER